MRKRTGLIIVFVVVAVAILTACGTRYAPPVQIKFTEAKLESGVYYNVTAADFGKMLGNNDFLLVNVHIPYAGEIPQTDLFVPYNEIEANLAAFPADKNAKVVVYCRSGSMSAIAAETLVKQGYTSIWNVQGGMAAWEKEGNRLIQKQ